MSARRVIALVGFGASLLSASASRAMGEPKAVRVQVRLRGASPTTPEPPVAVTVSPASDPAEARAPRRIDVPPARDIEISLAPGPWRLRAEAKGFWGPEVAIEAGEDAAPVVLTLWATGTLTGTASSPRLPPSDIWIAFQTAGGAEADLPAGEVSCPLTRGAWSCELPAGRLDLRLGAKGSVPHYRWDVLVKPHEASRLGQLSFVPGASLSGFLRPSAGVTFPTCRVELADTTGRPVLVPERERRRLQDPVYRSTPNSRGFFQMGPIPPGEYRLLATCDRRRGVAGVATLVRAGSESRLIEFLVLGRPAALDVTIAPTGDPWGGEWTVEAESLVDEFGYDTLRKVAKKGRARLEGLSAGEYLITVISSRGEKFLAEEVRIEPGSRLLALELAIVKLEGTVNLGSEPLVASLTFGGIYGVANVPFRSDENGHFSGFLPRSGTWEVDVTADDPPVTRRLRVDVTVSETKGRASVEIVLEDTKVTGEVVDEDGQPVPRALVRLVPSQPGRAESQLNRQADADGRFTFQGVPNGKLLLTAESWQASVAEPVEVLLSEDQLHVRLVAHKNLELRGRVLSAEGGAPIPGARVEAVPRVGLSMWPRAARTDAEGRFRLQGVPSGIKGVQFTAGAPGHVLRTVFISVPTDGPVVLVLQKGGGGSIVFEFPKDWDLRDPNGVNALLAYSGSVWPLTSMVFDWAPLQESNRLRVVLPRMPPGDYEACQTTTSLALLRIRPASGCRSGTLSPGGELTFAIRPPS